VHYTLNNRYQDLIVILIKFYYIKYKELDHNIEIEGTSIQN
jgi:hypothetical protein